MIVHAKVEPLNYSNTTVTFLLCKEWIICCYLEVGGTAKMVQAICNIWTSQMAKHQWLNYSV